MELSKVQQRDDAVLSKTLGTVVTICVRGQKRLVATEDNLLRNIRHYRRR